MASDTPTPPADDLQFDRVVDVDPIARAKGGATVACATCRAPITTEYYHLNGQPACDACRRAAQAHAATPSGASPMVRAVLLGVGAAIAGAVLYYAVMAITNLEIGIIAIACGYMVGWAVRKATAGRGGRRFQILAAVLTYWSVGLAYAPVAFGAMSEKRDGSRASSVVDSLRTGDTARTSPASRDSARAGGRDSARPTERVAPNDGSLLLALGAVFLFTFALPVIAVVSSLPGGLLSALIIFFGLRQAWQMTAAPAAVVSGPYRVGSAPAAA